MNMPYFDAACKAVIYLRDVCPWDATSLESLVVNRDLLSCGLTEYDLVNLKAAGNMSMNGLSNEERTLP